MPVTLTWGEIASRLTLSAIAGGLVGLNRGEQGRPAGLRTTLLVCLTASMAMIQANLLLGMVGRPDRSFVTLDPMRLPLGILSGMGFIGGGAILRRGNLILGVTTAATLWFVTVLGLCFGGGQHVLGVSALALGLGVLWGLKWVEMRLPQERQATLSLTMRSGGETPRELRREIESAGFRVVGMAFELDLAAGVREVRCDVRWRSIPTDVDPPACLADIAARPGMVRIKWGRD